jgi:hypothetical protein
VRTELNPLLIIPSLAHHPVQRNGQPPRHGDLGDLSSPAVCFIGKVAYEKYVGSRDFSFGWQDTIGTSRVFVMHFPLRGEAIVRVRELREVVRTGRD